MGDVGFGRDLTLGFDLEASYNEVWGSPALVGLYTDTPEFAPNIEQIRELHASGRPELTADDLAQGIRNYTLRVGGKIPKEALGLLLLSLLGQVTTTLVSTYQQHAFVVPTFSPPSLKFQFRTLLNATDTQWQMRGGIVKSMEINIVQNQMPRFAADIIGASCAKTDLNGAPTIPVPASGNPFYSPADMQSIVLNSGAEWTSMVLTMENVLAEDIEDSYELGSAERVRLFRAGSEDCFKVRATLKRIWSDLTMRESWSDFDDVDLTFYMGSAAAYYFKIRTPAKIVNTTEIPKGLGLVEETVEVEGFYKESGAGNELTVDYYDKQAKPITYPA